MSRKIEELGALAPASVRRVLQRAKDKGHLAWCGVRCKDDASLRVAHVWRKESDPWLAAFGEPAPDALCEELVEAQFKPDGPTGSGPTPGMSTTRSTAPR